jgi:hypothetical protein
MITAGQLPVRMRLLPLLLSLVTLLIGMWVGLVRIGWRVPPLQSTWVQDHGALMVSGFLGTLICLERAVALHSAVRLTRGETRLRDVWPFTAPLLTAIGTLLILIQRWGGLGPVLISLGSFTLLILFARHLGTHFSMHLLVMTLGGVCWTIGNVWWARGAPTFEFVNWWISFLVLTIAGERLELGRVLRWSRGARAAFSAAASVVLLGLIVSLISPPTGTRIFGTGLVGLALWLLVHDVARRTVRSNGLVRFVAFSLLSGFVWLGLGGLLALYYGRVVGGNPYDAFLHTIFLGFVISMIFGHAPIILPALVGRPMVFHRSFYLHLLLLHLSLLIRIWGDLSGWAEWRRWGGMFNMIAILLFLLVNGISLRRGVSSGTAGPPSSERLVAG